MAKLVGQSLSESSRIKALIDELVIEVQKHSEKINGVRDPQPEHMASNKALMERIAAFRGRPLQYPYVGTGVGQGVYVELEDGSIKMDLINGIGVHIQGHSHPEVIRASLVAGVMDIVNQGNLQANKEYLMLGEKLVKLAKGSRLKHAWLSTCGTIANENALKMARQKHSPAKLIIGVNNAFAGRSTMMAEITDNPAYKQGLPEYHEVLRVPYFDRSEEAAIKAGGGKTLSKLKELVAQNEGQIAAFVFEPVLGEGGYRVPTREFFLPLLQFCKEKDIAIWADEVQTFMRTGEAFAFQTFGFAEYVDLCTVAKTAQVGATLFTDEYNPKPGLVAGTFAGTTQALATGLKIIETIEQGQYLGPNGRILQIQNKFASGLQRLSETTCKGLLSDIEKAGLMLAFTPLDGSKDVTNNFLNVLYKNGIVTLGCGKGPFRVRFLIPMVITDQQIEEALAIIETTLQEVAKG